MGRKRMAFEVVVEPEADVDLDQILKRYGGEGSPLAQRFAKAFDELLDSFAIHPFYRVHYGKTRCFSMKTFPYRVHFIVDEAKNLVSISGIYYGGRDPEIWR